MSDPEFNDRFIGGYKPDADQQLFATEDYSVAVVNVFDVGYEFPVNRLMYGVINSKTTVLEGTMYNLPAACQFAQGMQESLNRVESGKSLEEVRQAFKQSDRMAEEEDPFTIIFEPEDDDEPSVN